MGFSTPLSEIQQGGGDAGQGAGLKLEKYFLLESMNGDVSCSLDRGSLSLWWQLMNGEHASFLAAPPKLGCHFHASFTLSLMQLSMLLASLNSKPNPDRPPLSCHQHWWPDTTTTQAGSPPGTTRTLTAYSPLSNQAMWRHKSGLFMPLF